MNAFFMTKDVRANEGLFMTKDVRANEGPFHD